MKQITRCLTRAFLLVSFCTTCSAAILLEGMSKERAEKELGIVMKRENIGFDRSEVGISIEFAPKGPLEGFSSAILDVYLEYPRRRLTSATLRPIVGTQDKVRLFFCVDPEYLGKTKISIYVHSSGESRNDGYQLSLNPKDFPNPQASQGTAENHR